MSVRHNDRVDYAVVNGQTGEVATDVPIDYKNYIYKRKRRQLNFSDFTPKFSYSFMEEILEHNDWIISTPMLYYQGEAVSVFNLSNNVTTLNINSRVGTFAVDEDILLNKSMKSENHKINRKLYAITPHGQFCRWESFTASFQLIR